MKKIMGFLFVYLLAYAGALQAAPGEFWELTSKMEGMGMAMPAQTSKECLPLKDEGDPAGMDKSCKVTDLKRIPNGSSWKMSCDDGTTGSGTQTRVKDTISSDIIMNTSEGSMKMSIKGKRVGGSCQTDAKAKAAMAEVQKSCELTARPTEEVMAATDMYLAKDGICVAKKAAFCSLVKRELPKDIKAYETYAYLKKNSGIKSNLDSGCGLNAENARQALCKSNADNRNQLNFLNQHCPAEAKLLREKIRREECAGRGFTSAGDKAACMAGVETDSGSASTSVTGSSSSSGPTAAPAGSDAGQSGDTTTNAVDKSKKALKGLKDAFGF